MSNVIPTDLFPTPPTSPDVSLRTLESYLPRTVSFLTAIQRDPEILGALEKYGYDTNEHEEGAKRVSALLGKVGTRKREADQLRAMNELDRVDENTFKVVTATLTRRFPEEAEEILAGVEPGEGMGAVLNLEVLLKRLQDFDARAASEERAASIIATLAKRGIDKVERDRLMGLVTLARQIGPASPSATVKDEAEKRYVQHLSAVRDWYLEWADIARLAIKRRDQLIRLGIASRRTEKEGDSGEPVPAPNPFPAPPAPPINPINPNPAPVV